MDEMVVRLKAVGGEAKKTAAKVISEVLIKMYIAGRVIGSNAKRAFIASKPVVKEAGIRALEVSGETSDIVISHTKLLADEMGRTISKNRGRILKTTLTAIAAVMVCIGIIMVGVTAVKAVSISEFSTENWINNPSDRMKMMDSLEASYTITDMNKNEIEQILGEPDVVMSKANCEYLALDEIEFDDVVEYQLNAGSRRISDVLEKHLAIAYKDGKVVWEDVIISDSMKQN